MAGLKHEVVRDHDPHRKAWSDRQRRLDVAANLDQLLTIATVARKAEHFARRYRTHTPETDFSHHTFEPATGYSARRRATQVFVDDLDFCEAQISQSDLHRILRLPTLNIVRHLKRGRLVS
jgi:hypothetical protein